MIFETENVEFKAQITDELSKEIIAFANTDGGVIYVGIDNDGNAIGIDDVDESIIVPRDGKLVALVTFNENVIDWNQEGEDEFFRKIEEFKARILGIVNKNVNRTSKVSAVQILREPFEKTATRKIRRFKYLHKEGL